MVWVRFGAALLALAAGIAAVAVAIHLLQQVV